MADGGHNNAYSSLSICSSVTPVICLMNDVGNYLKLNTHTYTQIGKGGEIANPTTINAFTRNGRKRTLQLWFMMERLNGSQIKAD